jgi:hypothetical protein
MADRHDGMCFRCSACKAEHRAAPAASWEEANKEIGKLGWHLIYRDDSSRGYRLHCPKCIPETAPG